MKKKEQEINFADLLRKLRTDKGLSQGRVAKVLGYTSPQFVSNWERGLSEPPLETLAKLAVLYDFSLEVFVNQYIQHRVQGLEKEIRSKFPKIQLKKTL